MAIEFKKAGRPSKRPSAPEFEKLYATYTASEIATMYGVTPSVVRMWAYRLRKQQKEALALEYDTTVTG